MRDKDWWKPANLEATEREFRSNDDLEKLDTNSDFGSYRVMRFLDDIEASQILSHNDIKPKYRAKAIKSILRNKSVLSILDLGCGLGFTTNELRLAFPGSKVTGIDLSEDATLYATSKFNECAFRCEAIDPLKVDQKFQYDLITAFEFYPFTRTNSLKDHVDYIEHITKDLNVGATLVIFQRWDNPMSLSVNYEALQSRFPSLHFECYNMPIRKIGSLISWRRLAVLVSVVCKVLFRFFLNRNIGLTKVVVISKIKRTS